VHLFNGVPVPMPKAKERFGRNLVFIEKTTQVA
jgi:hypothetical protein